MEGQKRTCSDLGRNLAPFSNTFSTSIIPDTEITPPSSGSSTDDWEIIKEGQQCTEGGVVSKSDFHTPTKPKAQTSKPKIESAKEGADENTGTHQVDEQYNPNNSRRKNTRTLAQAENREKNRKQSKRQDSDMNKALISENESEDDDALSTSYVRYNSSINRGSHDDGGSVKIVLPLGISGSDNMQKRKSKCSRGLKSLICCILFTAIIVTLSILVPSVTLYEKQTFAKLNSHSDDTSVALEGDYIQLYYSVNKHLTTIYDYRLMFTFSPPKDSLNSSASIYSIPCDSLLKKANKTEQFTNSQVNVAVPILLPLLTRIYFDSCSEYKTGICILDQYIYQAKSRVSVIIYNITLDSYKPGETQIRILAYDSFDDFQQFLYGYGPLKAVKHVRVNARNYYFLLNSEEMKRSAYYFFAIQNIKGSSKWFTVNRIGFHVYYDASNLSPNCLMNNFNNYSCEIKATGGQCLLGHVQINVNDSSSTSDQLYHINGSITSAATSNGLLIVFAVSIVAIVVALFILSVCCCVRFSCNGCKNV